MMFGYFLSFILVCLLLSQAYGQGDFTFYFESTCDPNNGWRYEPAAYTLSFPQWWDGQCLLVSGTNEHFTLEFQQTFGSQPSAQFRLQIWDPTIFCGLMMPGTITDTFVVQSVGSPDIVCQPGQYTTANTTHSFTYTIWMTVIPDPITQPSSTGMPVPPFDVSSSSSSSSIEPVVSSSTALESSSSSSSEPVSSSTGASSSSQFSSSYTPVSSSSSTPFPPFDSSMLDPTGPVVPDTSTAFQSTGSPSHEDGGKSSNALVIGIVSGVVFVVVVLVAVGVYFLMRRRRQSQDQLPSLQNNSSLRESLYSRDSRFSDDY